MSSWPAGRGDLLTRHDTSGFGRKTAQPRSTHRPRFGSGSQAGMTSTPSGNVFTIGAPEARGVLREILVHQVRASRRNSSLPLHAPSGSHLEWKGRTW